MAVKVKKSNRIIEVNENELAGYLKRGYDQIDSKGEITKYATGGKKVSIAEFNKLREENEKLKASGNTGNTKELEEKIKELTEQNEELKADVAVYEKENTDLNNKLKSFQNKQGSNYNKNR